MNKPNFTPGKWIADHNTSVVLTLDENGECEHVIARHVIDFDLDLISASKEMYYALKAIREYGVGYADKLIDEALKKADGIKEK